LGVVRRRGRWGRWRGLGHHQADGAVGRAAEAGPAAAWLCSDQAAFVTGTTLTVDGAMTAGMPRSAARPPEAAARPSDL
jgi:NAD(P)-dependent dehydrogenase (short-subunit alcohol dehydrogenase family)